MRPNGAQVRKALRRARLDEDEHLLAGVPELFSHRQAHGGLQLAEHIPLADELRAGQRPSPSNRRPPTAPARPRPQPSAAGRRRASPPRAPGTSPAPAPAANPPRTSQRPSPRRNPASSGAQGRSPPAPRPAPPSPPPPSRASGTAHRPPPHLARQQALSLARLEAIRLADGARIPFERSPCVIRRDRFQRALPIRHAAPP